MAEAGRPKPTSQPEPGAEAATNAVRARSPRTRSGGGADRAARATEPRAPAENAIRPTAKRRREALAPERDAAAAPGAAASSPERRAAEEKTQRSETIPEAVRERFVQVGRKYYFRDGARAFTDRGSRLTTPSENSEVIRSLITIAQGRGWQDVTVTGTERFRREAWSAARQAGLEVRGYRPTQFEQEHLARTVARRQSEAASARVERAGEDSAVRAAAARASGARGREGLIQGRLIDHGPAAFHHDPHERMSYFARIETERGERTLWGVDLQRAFRESLTRPQIGDEIGLRALRKDAVTVKAPQHDVEGRLVGEREIQTHRNRWVVEKREFFAARSTAARTVRDTSIGAGEAMQEHPELAGTYLYLKGAEEIARRKIRDPEDQKRFVETVRGALADSIARGEPLAAVRLKERIPGVRVPKRPLRENEREQVAVRG